MKNNGENISVAEESNKENEGNDSDHIEEENNEPKCEMTAKKYSNEDNEILTLFNIVMW